MYKRTVKVINVSGLHARPGSDFVHETKKFSSKITIRRIDEDRTVNAKSLAYILTLGIGKGTEVELTADGPDEKEAVDFLCSFIEDGLGEGKKPINTD